MLSVAVHKDIGEYTEKVVGKLSARTLACTAGGLASSVATAAALNLALGVPVDAATLPVMARLGQVIGSLLPLRANRECVRNWQENKDKYLYIAQ